MFRDQKIANQFAVRRMFRWYMPLFRQFLEWSILNTGVILRERPKGKKLWSAINLKLKLAEQLSFLGEETVEPANNITVGSDRESQPEDEPTKTCLRRDVLHVPDFLKRRRACRVHMQRKTTSLYCCTCNRALCSKECWIRYHSKINYLLNDNSCRGKILHRTARD